MVHESIVTRKSDDDFTECYQCDNLIEFGDVVHFIDAGSGKLIGPFCCKLCSRDHLTVMGRFAPKVAEAAHDAAADVHKLVTDNIKLAYYFAQKFGKMYKLDMEEAQQSAMLGLVKAAEKFDPARGSNFASLARAYIRNELRHMVRHIRGQKLARVDMDSPAYDDDGETTTHDVIGSRDRDLDRVGAGDEADEIWAHVDELDEPERTWVRRHLNGETYRDIAKDSGVSFVYVGVKIRKALEALRAQLSARGVTPQVLTAHESSGMNEHEALDIVSRLISKPRPTFEAMAKTGKLIRLGDEHHASAHVKLGEAFDPKASYVLADAAGTLQLELDSCGNAKSATRIRGMVGHLTMLAGLHEYRAYI